MRPIVTPKLLLRALVVWGVVVAGACADPLRFFALGDVPYRASEVAPLTDLLRDATASRGLPFIVHVGDIKKGREPCTDAGLDAIAALFRAQPVPVVYTPGDNEWTDCHRAWSGERDPMERLARLREVFFADESVLRLGALTPVRTAPGYPEIYYFRRGDLLFAALHVVGSNNGLRGAGAGAAAEAIVRDQANHELLTRLAEVAQEQGTEALVLFFQADPQFERPKPQRGLRPLRRDLIELMKRFLGPVLAIHGDGHRYRHDHPLIDPATDAPFERFTRVEVPGSPVVGGVWITVDPGSDAPFEVAPVYPVSADGLDDR